MLYNKRKTVLNPHIMNIENDKLDMDVKLIEISGRANVDDQIESIDDVSTVKNKKLITSKSRECVKKSRKFNKRDKVIKRTIKYKKSVTRPKKHKTVVRRSKKKN